MTVKKENIKEHLEVYKSAFLEPVERPTVSKEQIEEFANYLDDVIVDKIKAKDYNLTPGSINGFECRYNGFNISVSIPIKKVKMIIPGSVDFGMIDDEIEDVLNEMYKGKIEFEVMAEMRENSVEFDIDVSLD